MSDNGREIREHFVTNQLMTLVNLAIDHAINLMEEERGYIFAVIVDEEEDTRVQYFLNEDLIEGLIEGREYIKEHHDEILRYALGGPAMVKVVGSSEKEESFVMEAEEVGLGNRLLFAQRCHFQTQEGFFERVGTTMCIGEDEAFLP